MLIDGVCLQQNLRNAATGAALQTPLSLTRSVSHPFPPMTLWLCHTQMVRNGAYTFKIGYVPQA